MASQRVAVVGYGSDIRADDKAGIYVVDTLEQSLSGVSFYKGLNAVDLVAIFPDFDKVIIVDAAFIDASPGEFVRAAYDELHLPDDSSFSHDMNFSQVAEIAHTIGVRVPQLVFYLIRPQVLEISEEFSSAMERSIPSLLRAVREEALGESGSSSHETES